jgi:hypothetical protein
VAPKVANLSVSGFSPRDETDYLKRRMGVTNGVGLLSQTPSLSKVNEIPMTYGGTSQAEELIIAK